MGRGAVVTVKVEDWSSSSVDVTPSGQPASTLRPSEVRRVELPSGGTINIEPSIDNSPASATLKVEDWSAEAIVVNDVRLLRPSDTVRFSGSDGALAVREAGPLDYAGIIPPQPTIAALTPDIAVVGSPDFELFVNGANFQTYSRIVWNGVDEPTTYTSPAQVSTIVKPSTASGPGVVQVAVHSGSKYTANLPFTFITAEEEE